MSSFTRFVDWISTSISAASSLTGTEKLPIIQGSATKSVTSNALASWITQSFLGFLQSGTGAVTEPVQVALRRFLFVAQFGTLAQALTAAVSKRLWIDSAVTIAGNTTIPVGMEVYVVKGGVFNVANAATLTINSPFSAALYQVFACTGTGAVSFGSGAVAKVYPEWFGAVGDAGTTDNFAPFQKALNSMTNGGTFEMADGKFKLTDEVVIPAVGGITIQGAGGVNFVDGSPVPSGSGTFLYQATNGKAIFSVAGGASHLRMRDFSLSPALIPTHTPPGVAKLGIKLRDSSPDVIWDLVFERVLFYNLDVGIQCIDPLAGTGTDWSVAPVTIKQCWFNYPGTGVYLETNNADMWVYDTSLFFVPTNGIGVHLYRFGIQHFKDCISAGESVSTNRFIYIDGNGSGSVDKILVENSQAETLTQFICLAAGGGYTAFPFVIECNNCVAELNADIFLGNNVHFISKNNRWSADIYIDDPDVRISTNCDHFDTGAEFTFLQGDPRSVFLNTTWGPNPSATYGTYTYINGRLTAHASAAPTSGGPTWNDGDIVWNTAPASGGAPGWMCTTEGTFSAATDNTGDTDGSTGVITGMADTSDFNVGQYVTVSAGFATTGPFKITALTASTMTVNANSNSSQSNVTVATPDPVFKAMANLA